MYYPVMSYDSSEPEYLNICVGPDCGIVKIAANPAISHGSRKLTVKLRFFEISG